MDYKDKFLLEEKQIEELLSKHIFNKKFYPISEERELKHLQVIKELRELKIKKIIKDLTTQKK